MANKDIPFLSLEPQLRSIKSDLQKAIARVTKSGMFILGNEVDSFEKKYAAFHGTSYCVGTGNGFDALYLSMKALGIGRGDEVIVPSNTCMPTWMAVMATGATIVPAEPNINTYNIDPNSIASVISKKTKAIIPVHLYGQACDMDRIMDIANKHGVAVIEDNAQAHGTSFNGQITGSFGIINAHSFYPTKNLGALGDGGAITTNNIDLANSIKSLRNYGGAKNIANEQGINSRLDELQAAILSVKLKKLNQWNRERTKIAAFYNKELKKSCDVNDVKLPEVAPGATHVFHLYTIRTPKRDELRAYLAKKNIDTKIHYEMPPHLQGAFKELSFKNGQFPLAEEISNTTLSLPLWPGMSPVQTEKVVEGIRSFFA